MYCILSLIGGIHKDQVQRNTLISTSAKVKWWITLCMWYMRLSGRSLSELASTLIGSDDRVTGWIHDVGFLSHIYTSPNLQALNLLAVLDNTAMGQSRQCGALVSSKLTPSNAVDPVLSFKQQFLIFLLMGIAPRPRLLSKSACLLYPLGDKASPTARNRIEVVCSKRQRC